MSNWSWRLGRFKGIDLFVHWTFLIVVGWIVMSSLLTGKGALMALLSVGFVLLIFGCVVLHELGHALAAARYGIGTVNITLLPIGGIARLDRLPHDPREELWIALAGPAVNVAIAAVLMMTSSLLQALAPTIDAVAVCVRLLSDLMWINLGLAAFNMLPAFPLDGGRVLRSLLAMRLDRIEATQFAAALGQAVAILIGLVGLFFNWLLLIIALFVYFGADYEARLVETHAALRDAQARNAMLTHIHVLSQNDSLDKAASDWFDSRQSDFPVLDHGQLVGVLDCGHLVKALAEVGPEERVGNVMDRDWPTVEDSAALDTTLAKLQEDRHASLPVLHQGHFVGMVTMQSIGQWMKTHSVLEEDELSDELICRSH